MNEIHLSFGDALIHLREGRKVCRAGWNGKGMWLRLVMGDAMIYPQSVTPVEEQYPLLPYIQMKTADNCLVPWLASQTDMLAVDWMVVS